MPLAQNEKNLMRRYLLWCYKTTKEELDKIDRYFTQEKADRFILKNLKKNKELKIQKTKDACSGMVKDFEEYIELKILKANKKKFLDEKKKDLHPGYHYLRNRLEGIEKAGSHFLGKKAFDEIINLYEKEMTERILSAREHT